jgi:hypothetical protein
VSPRILRGLVTAVALLFFGGALVLAAFFLGNDHDSTTKPTTKLAATNDSPDASLKPDSQPKRRRRRRRPRHGVVRVRSQPPGARISYCGRPTGKVTPAQLRARAGRSCALQLKLDGYEPYAIDVTPRAGRRASVVATLRRKRPGAQSHNRRTGKLTVTSIQVGTVMVNGRRAGRTPRLDLDLRPGSYSVKVYFNSLDRYSDPKQVQIRAGQVSRLHFDPGP